MTQSRTSDVQRQRLGRLSRWRAMRLMHPAALTKNDRGAVHRVGIALPFARAISLHMTWSYRRCNVVHRPRSGRLLAIQRIARRGIPDTGSRRSNRPFIQQAFGLSVVLSTLASPCAMPLPGQCEYASNEQGSRVSARATLSTWRVTTAAEDATLHRQAACIVSDAKPIICHAAARRMLQADDTGRIPDGCDG